jgi:hypothetical protein
MQYLKENEIQNVTDAMNSLVSKSSLKNVDKILYDILNDQKVTAEELEKLQIFLTNHRNSTTTIQKNLCNLLLYGLNYSLTF